MFPRLRKGGLSRKEQLYVLDFARKTIECKASGKDLPKFDDSFLVLKEERGVFVTLNKKGNLRGCIGLLSTMKPLHESIQEVAQAAAFQDPRFQPVTRDELPEIDIEISIITPIRRVKNIKKIKVGRHGLLVRYGDAQGLLLPQVAVKNAWSRRTFLEHTCVKAGLPRDAWQHPETEIMTFSAHIFTETS